MESSVEITLFQVVYSIVNIVRTYCIYELMRVFFKKSYVKREKIFLSFVVYDIAITLLFLFVHIPMIMLFCNIGGLLLLSLLYQESQFKRIFGVSFVLFILLAVEAIITVLTGYINIPFLKKVNYNSIWGMITLQIVLFAVTQCLKKFQSVKEGESIPKLYWVCIVAIPATSIYVSIILLYAEGLSVIQITICHICLLFINVAMFVLYDGFIISFKAREERKMLLQHNNYYLRQLDTMQTTENALRALKHDWINHLSALKELAFVEETEKLTQYIYHLEQEIVESNHSVHSGNIVIDSILNDKQRTAEQKKIQLHINVALPKDLEIDAFDYTVVLGNLLDNAIQASDLLMPEKRWIELEIKYDVGMVIIYVKNNYNGKVKYDNGVLKTTKHQSEQHGFGMQNIKKIVEKNEGFIKIKYDESVFEVTVMLLENRK